MVQSKFWCVFVKIILLSHRNKSGVTLANINIMYIKSSIPLRVVTNNTGTNSIYIVFLEKIQRSFYTKCGQ